MGDPVFYQPARSTLMKHLVVRPVQIRSHVAIVASGDRTLRLNDRPDVLSKGVGVFTHILRKIMGDTGVQTQQENAGNG